MPLPPSEKWEAGGRTWGQEGEQAILDLVNWDHSWLVTSTWDVQAGYPRKAWSCGSDCSWGLEVDCSSRIAMLHLVCSH